MRCPRTTCGANRSHSIPATNGAATTQLVTSVVAQHLEQGVTGGHIAFDDQHPGGSGHQAIQRDAVLLHEFDQAALRDPPVFGTGDSVSLDVTLVEPFAHRACRDIADLGNFAGGQNFFLFLKIAHHESLQCGHGNRGWYLCRLIRGGGFVDV